MGVVRTTGVNDVPTVIDGSDTVVLPGLVGMEVTAKHRNPQRLSRLEQDTGSPELDFHRDDFAGVQLDLSLVPENRLIRR